VTDPQDTQDRAAQLAEFRPRVYRHLLAMTCDPALPDDLTQETFLRAVPRADQFRSQDAALGWLYRVATNVMVDHARLARTAGLPADTGSSPRRVQPACWGRPRRHHRRRRPSGRR